MIALIVIAILIIPALIFLFIRHRLNIRDKNLENEDPQIKFLKAKERMIVRTVVKIVLIIIGILFGISFIFGVILGLMGIKSPLAYY